MKHVRDPSNGTPKGFPKEIKSSEVDPDLAELKLTGRVYRN